MELVPGDRSELHKGGRPPQIIRIRKAEVLGLGDKGQGELTERRSHNGRF